jgi:transcriptional regulator with XRE-family HTH domain
MALGKNIEHLRTLLGFSRGVVARSIGLDDDQPLYALEKRDSRRSNLAPALAKFFNVPLEALLEHDLTKLTSADLADKVEPAPQLEKLVGDKASLLRVFDALDKNGQAELLRYANYLLSTADSGQ